MKFITFYSIIKILKINPYITVSASCAKSIKEGWRKPIPVLIKINGKPDKYWLINLIPTGKGSFYLYLHGKVRKESNTKVGDRVHVEILFDSKYRGGPSSPIPRWFQIELNKNGKANESWNKLTPSRKKEIIRYLLMLKSDEARKRNLVQAINVLSGNEARFMGRAWKDGV